MLVSQFFQVLRFRIRTVLAVLLVTVGTTAVILTVLPRGYTATTDLVINIKGIDPLGENLINAQLLPGYIATQTEIIATTQIAMKVVKRLGLDRDPAMRNKFLSGGTTKDGKPPTTEALAETLKARVKVKPGRESSMISINYTAADPAFAATVANAFADAYLDTNQELARDAARQTSAWLHDQLASMRQALEEAQRRLSDYQQQHSIVAGDQGIDIETARLSELSNKLGFAENERFQILAKQRQAAVAGAGNRYADTPEVINHTFVQQIKSEVIRQEKMVNELNFRLGANHPRYRTALEELNSLRGRLDHEISVIGTGIREHLGEVEKQVASLRAALADQKAKVLKLKRHRDEIAILQGQAQNAQYSYDFAMKRANQAALESALGPTNISVLNRAYPPDSASTPNVRLGLGLALFIGLMLATTTAFLLETLNRRIHHETDLRTVLAAPVLGTISAAEGAPAYTRINLSDARQALSGAHLEGNPEAELAADSEQPAHGLTEVPIFAAPMLLRVVTGGRKGFSAPPPLSGPTLAPPPEPASGGSAPPPVLAGLLSAHGQLAAELRAVRGALLFRGVASQRRVLPVLGAGSGEGRSFFCAALGTVFAQLGKRVLLIDANLWAPCQNRLLCLPQSPGLVDVLQQGDRRDPARPVPGIARFWAVAAGADAANPCDLLSGSAFPVFIERCRENYDLVLIDTPAACTHVEALTVAALSGYALVLARRNSTRYEDFKRLIERARDAQIDILGTILNNH